MIIQKDKKSMGTNCFKATKAYKVQMLKIFL